MRNDGAYYTFYRYSSRRTGKNANLFPCERNDISKWRDHHGIFQLHEKDLADLSMTLNNWQQIGTQAIQSKQQQLLAPLYKKVMDAVNVVAKEKGYTYLFHPDAFLIDPPEADDLTLVVAKKLGLNIPNANAPAAPAKPAAATPAKK